MAFAIEEKEPRFLQIAIWKMVLLQGLVTLLLSYLCLVKGYGMIVLAFCIFVLVGLPILFQPKIGLLLGIALNVTSASAIFLGGFYMVVVALTMVSWVLRLLSTEPTFAYAPQNRFVYAFSAILILSLISSAHPELSFQSLEVYLKVVLFYFLLVNIANTPQFIRATVWVIILSALSVSLYGLYQFLSAPPVMGVLNRIVSTREDPNNLALTLVSVIPLTVALVTIEKRRMLKAIAALTGIVVFFTVPLTLSRGGFLALIAIVVLVVAKMKRKKFALLILVLMIGLSLFILPATVWERAGTVGISSMEASARMRMQLLKGGLEMFSDHPFLGVGIGNFIAHSFQYSGLVPPQYAHNMFLHVAAETGILGFLLFVAILYSSWRILRRVQSSTVGDRTSLYFQLAQGLEISLLGFCVAAFFLSQHFNKMLWIIIGLTASVHRLHSMETG
jgi:probable O-glycosylation ligase (exosortase A-associated)